ncbi:hypothetical protein [Desulfogranum mediterraneum]|uniref:hypothetical protein n=1 Tax=Desulfogranum mediterraneum TaxID=160661 RepID=UPI00041AC9B9|nr:hypothetical protein [Desulfogranum mediterraneum]
MTRHLLLTLLLVTLLLSGQAQSVPASVPSQGDRDITIALPAETVLHSLQAMLPLEITTPQSALDGQIMLTDLSKLDIRDNTLSVEGVLHGSNLSLVTTIANQQIRLKLGEVKLPVSCDLLTRFDPARKKLFITPTFPRKQSSVKPAGAALRPLLAALGGKEYPLSLKSLQLLNITIGDRQLPLPMIPVKISGRENTLILQLRPQVGGR